MGSCINLKAEMARAGITPSSIAQVLGLSERAVRARIQGERDFTWNEARTIRAHFFPALGSDYLFERLPK